MEKLNHFYTAFSSYPSASVVSFASSTSLTTTTTFQSSVHRYPLNALMDDKLPLTTTIEKIFNNNN